MATVHLDAAWYKTWLAVCCGGSKLLADLPIAILKHLQSRLYVIAKVVVSNLLTVFPLV